MGVILMCGQRGGRQHMQLRAGIAPRQLSCLQCQISKMRSDRVLKFVFVLEAQIKSS